MLLSLYLSSLALSSAHAAEPGPVHAAEVGPALPADWANAPPATWTVVLQTSGLMRPVAEAAREPIARLVEAMPPGDRIEILVVHTRSSPVLNLRTVDDTERAALAAEIRALELPSAKATDFGAAFTTLAERLDKAGESTPRFVLMVGNFCHEPPLESVYADGGYGCRVVRGFDKLDASFDSGGDRATIDATLFPVSTGGQPVHESSLDQARAFFEPGGTVAVSTTPLAAWVEERRPHAATARYGPIARAEAARLSLRAEVTEAPTSERPMGTILLRTGLEHLGFEARQITVKGARSDVQSLTLSPNGRLSVAVDVPPGPFSFVRTQDTVEVPVEIRVDGELSPAATLRALNVEPERTGLTATVVLQVQRSYGLSPFRSLVAGAGAFALVLVGVLLGKRRLAPVRLGGNFSYRRSGGARQTLAIEQLQEAPIVIRPDGSLGIGRREDSLLVLRAERPLWNTRFTVEIRTGNTEINARPISTGRHPVVPGATSFQFRDYRLSWE